MMGHNYYLYPRLASTALFTLLPTTFTHFQRCNSSATTAKLLKHKQLQITWQQSGEHSTKQYSTRKEHNRGSKHCPEARHTMQCDADLCLLWLSNTPWKRTRGVEIKPHAF
jgi:hypothetical protein